MRFAVIACSGCRTPWVIETRAGKVRCPNCTKAAEVKRRTRLWAGDDANEARVAAGEFRAKMVWGESAPAPPTPQPARHDDPLDAAAAKASGVRAVTAKAEAVALWLTRLMGEASHDEYVEAMGRAGIPRQRAEKEVVRMLATDVVFEPRTGSYRLLD